MAGRPRIPESEKWENNFKKKNIAVSNEHAKFLLAMKNAGQPYTDYFADRINADDKYKKWKGEPIINHDDELLAAFTEYAEAFTSWAEKLNKKMDSLEEKLNKML